MCEGDGVGCCVPKKPFEIYNVTLFLLHFILEKLFCINPMLACHQFRYTKSVQLIPCQNKISLLHKLCENLLYDYKHVATQQQYGSDLSVIEFVREICTDSRSCVPYMKEHAIRYPNTDS